MKQIPTLTPAERQARLRKRKQEQTQQWRSALRQIISAKTIEEAREIAVEVLIDDQ